LADGATPPSVFSGIGVLVWVGSVEANESPMADAWSDSSSLSLTANCAGPPLGVSWGGVRGGKGTASGVDGTKDDRFSDDDLRLSESLGDNESVESECPFIVDTDASPILHLAKTWLTICVRPPWATIWLTGSWLSKNTLYTVLTALSRDEWWTRIVGDRTSAKSALTIWRETGSGVVSV
jgi:hypothetical protein